MTALSEIFDAERNDIQKNYDAQKQLEERFFERRVKPVLERIVAEIEKDGGFAAGYAPGGDNGSYIVQNSRDSQQFDWVANIELKNKAGEFLGRASIRMMSSFPEEVSMTTPGTNGSSTRTYRLSADTIKMNEDRYYSTLDRPYAELVEKGYKSLAEDIVRKAAENSMEKYASRLRNAPYIPRLPG